MNPMARFGFYIWILKVIFRVPGSATHVAESKLWYPPRCDGAVEVARYVLILRNAAASTLATQ